MVSVVLATPAGKIFKSIARFIPEFISGIPAGIAANTIYDNMGIKEPSDLTNMNSQKREEYYVKKIKKIPITWNNITSINESIINLKLDFMKPNSLDESYKLTILRGYQKGLQDYKNKDYRKAMTQFKKLSEVGYVEPTFMVGSMYCDGKASSVAPTQAEIYFRRAGSNCLCSQHGALRCTELTPADKSIWYF